MNSAHLRMLKVNNRLHRVVKIFTVLVDQISILDTMTLLDFAAFRDELGTSSGFQRGVPGVRWVLLPSLDRW